MVNRLIHGSVATDANSTLDHPLEHLVACHRRIEERLETLERAAAHLESQPEEARQALAAVFRYFETSGAMHTADEEQSVFPRLAARLTAEEKGYVESLEAQHREAEALYQRLLHVPAPGESPAEYGQTVAKFCELYRGHIASENDRLIAAAKRLLTPLELEAISSEMRSRRWHSF